MSHNTNNNFSSYPHSSIDDRLCGGSPQLEINPPRHGNIFDLLGLPCPNCGLTGDTKIVPMPVSKDYVALRCHECNRFISWIRKPENQLRRGKIKDWLNNHKLRLSEWEREFLADIQSYKKLSPKQQSCFDKIQSRLGGTK